MYIDRPLKTHHLAVSLTVLGGSNGLKGLSDRMKVKLT